jgi:hypothetical protein
VADTARCLGALALLGVGAAHLQQYADDSYNLVPTIGTLFLLNFISATVVGLALLVPLRRATAWAGALRAALAVAAMGIAAGSLTALLVSEDQGLFGFMEQGYRQAIVLTIVLEAVTVALMAVFLVADGAVSGSRSHRPLLARPRHPTGGRSATRR